ncbi:MAG TPA: alpha-amylase family glycosyl hydrolase [Opitutaceae bacterium]|nr:alpha-amylase family glycosyl hydrolase [Opitutaceae bacterium]
MNPASLREIDFAALRGQLPDRELRVTTKYHPSPAAWEDQVLYFLMLDRFSDGREAGYRDGRNAAAPDTPVFSAADNGNAVSTEAAAAAWRDAGGDWCGGTLSGLTAKMGYLKRLGITALWVSPLFKQVSERFTREKSYHGYGIQDFLAVDPRFGTAEDLRTMVRTAHEHGIYVILDVILNHAGNVFAYRHDDPPPRWNGSEHEVAGYRDATGAASLPFYTGLPADTSRDAAIWPRELQPHTAFAKRGTITNWDWYPEYLEGDFCTLKELHLGVGETDSYAPSAALQALAEVYRYWIAYADIDGYRIDTVKHMDTGAVRYFGSVIHEFAQRLGKENFYLIGEITGGRVFAFNKLEATGLDAALGVDDIPDKLEYLVKGWRNPEEYFALFRNSLLVGKESHTWFRNKVVTLFDDHDQVRKGGNKARFCAGDAAYARQVAAAVGLEATTLGVPLVYYGTEQAFDGAGDNDRYLRECMFGGRFGAFRSQGRHFFDETHPAYREIAAILAVRARTPALRRGRQYLRQISGNGVDFGYPRLLGGQLLAVVPWSRLFDGEEVLCALNTDASQPRSAWVVVDHDLNPVAREFRCLYSPAGAQLGGRVAVEERGGCRCIHITVPPGGFVIWGQT